MVDVESVETGSGKMEKPREMADKIITITGIVIPFAWDEGGHVTAVAISTADEKEYLLDAADVDVALSDMIRQEIRVRGTLRAEGDKQVIVAREIRLKSAWDPTGHNWIKNRPRQ